MSCSAIANLEESPLSDSKMDISDATNSLESTGVSPVVEHPRNNHNSIHSAPTLAHKIPLLMSSAFHGDESHGTGGEIADEHDINCTTNENQDIQMCSNEISGLEDSSTQLHELDNRRIDNNCGPVMLSLSEKSITGLTVANSHPLMSPNGTDSDSDNSCLVQADANRKFHNFPDVIPNRERHIADLPVQRNNKLQTCETIAANQRVLTSSLVSAKNNLNSNIAKGTAKNKLSVLRAHSPDLLSSGSEADISQYHATVEPNFQSVALIPNANNANISNAQGNHRKNKISNGVGDVPVGADDISSIDSISNHSFDDDEDLEHNLASLSPSSSLIDGLDDDDDDDDDCEGPEIDDDFPEGTTPTNMKLDADALPQYSAEEERRDSRNWQKITLPDGRTREIDMKVIEPYKRVLSHGGYLKAGGHNAIVIFCACHLPDRSRADYHYVMDNLFLYVVKTLEQLVTEDYVLIYLHGGTNRRNMPPFPWLKKCYQLLDRRLRKSLKNMYLVHPTFWIKSIVWMARPFVSTKFWRKLIYVKSLEELGSHIAVEKAAIPDKVKQYDAKYN